MKDHSEPLTSDQMVMSRRKFVLGAASLAVAAAIPSLASAGEWSPWPQVPSRLAKSTDDFWVKPRVLRLKRYQNNENVDVAYWKNGHYDAAGYQKLCWLLRDTRAHSVVAMDVRILDLLCAMQAWVSYYGYSKPFFVTSGYRSAATNQAIEGAARNSMHLYGKAVDIIVPDLPVSYLGQLAQHYAGGGVGFYPAKGFVHVDTGRVRTWGRRR